ncbi:winged helix-turn-helix transcriptional regulator [Micromonospora sp. NPDC049836]|uniref:winged helix-turn-helix transcriptional regulator n=1 Tax=Micromonospora sp. NPDC049836 TaxID=3364274 RepID=UPI0037A40371
MTQLDDGVLDVAVGRSACPINLCAELLGDRWSVIVLRDLTFRGPLHFREILTGSTEGIATNILTSRLNKLVAAGMLTRHADEHHRQKVRYHLTEAAIDFVPVLTAIGAWGNRWLPADPDLGSAAAALAAGGARLQQDLMHELRREHLDGQPLGPDSLRHRLLQNQSSSRGS